MSILEVKSVNLHWGSNSRAHRTNNFEICHDCDDPTPVLRRGQTFRLSVKFDRPFNHIIDIVRVYFNCLDVEDNFRRSSSVANITVTRGSSISRDNDVWSVSLISQEENSIHLYMRSPKNIPFATYELQIDTKNKSRSGMKKYVHHKNVYFLFNPWEKEDKVYMPQKELLDEYVLSDVGKIFVSSEKNPKGEPWIFGQFAKPVLPALIMALSRSKLDYTKRGNPVYLTRELTKVLCAVQSEDREAQGVLMGRWEDGYNHDHCTNPTLWNNSISIFEEYLNSEGTPVKYGECWVFSAITTTACRAIGIPCRSVTNFSSARDNNSSMTIEKYIIPENNTELRESYEDEKIWEFHAWNDVWMSRYDLPQGYGGWQAIDSTPVKGDYDGSYQCGPASLVAIRKGEINHNYEVDYFTSALNADVVNFVFDEEEEEFKAVSIEQNKVGRLVLTKRPHVYDPNGNADFEDITELYKEKEGTKEERLAFFNALKHSDYNSEVYKIADISFVQFKLTEIESLDIGDEMAIHVEMKNESTFEEKTAVVNISVSTLYYNGNKGCHIKNITEKIKIQPDHTDIVKLRIPAEEYAPKLVELAFVKVSAIGRILENNFNWAAEDHFVVNLPEIVIKAKEDLKRNKEGSLLFTIRNPLKRKLTGCKFIFEASGIGKNIPVPCRDVMPEEEVTVERKAVPEKAGNIFITAQFVSAQLKCMTGHSSLRIY